MPAVQSVLFSRERSPKDVNGGRGWSAPAAQRWLFEHGFGSQLTDSTGDFHRFRQFDPRQLAEGTVRTKKAGFPAGVQAVTGDRNR